MLPSALGACLLGNMFAGNGVIRADNGVTRAGKDFWLPYPLKNFEMKILIGCFAKIGQDQHLKLGLQCHILFYKVFFNKGHSKPPSRLPKYLWQELLKSPQALIYFSDLPPLFKIWNWKLSLGKKVGGWYCET